MNLFKSKTISKTVEKSSFKNKTTNEIIEEIHESFYTEVDNLLADAKILNSLDTDKNEIIEKCERLKSLGFKNTIEIKEAEDELNRLEKLSSENQSKKTLTEAINYFSFKYPNYKFITEDSVKKICAKYNLIYGEIGRYIGSVPDKNLKHIEDFKIDQNDECFIYEERMFGFGLREMSMQKNFITFNEHRKRKYTENEHYKRGVLQDRRIHTINMKLPLEIAAPIKDFEIDKMEVTNFKLSKIEIPDPVVLKPVIFKGQKHYLIVTAWGIEASDELIINEKLN